MTADPTVLDLADRAAQAVRDLNHRTRHADAFTGPAQLYRLVGDLILLIGALTQLLGQLEGWLHAEHDAGRVRSDNHADPGPAVSDAADDLAEAGDAARDVASLLTGAHQHLARLGGLAQPDDPTNTRGHRSNDLALLADGPEPGWWDEKGRPAPWPNDVFDPDSGRTTAGSATADDPPVTHTGEPRS